MRQLLILLIGIMGFACTKPEVSIQLNGLSDPKVDYGVAMLTKALEQNGVMVSDEPGNQVISLNLDNSFASQEAYQINLNENTSNLIGADASGLLYACLDLARKVNEEGSLPENYQTEQTPDMVLRGTCIGLQKTTYLPGRSVYEYPYTPETFPWFYDKNLWLQYLDMMATNRFNALFLWNGHPFASLVKLDDYPYALEVDEATFRKNEEIFTFLTTEAEKRGIWVIQMFYNIILPKPLADKHGIKTQDRSRPILPIAEDYSRKAIAAFVEKYPNVGLLVALGEAMQGIENDVRWFTETVIPGVQDGLKALGKKNEPPIVLRGHDTDAAVVMKNALPLYQNLFTLNKFNGESLTTYEPKGKWAEYHKSLSELGSTHIDNVHLLSNLEPFRYGSPDFIQKSVKAMKSAHGANGLHLYPQTSYWEWPYPPDKTDPLLLEMERDWIWYEAWGRYAWNTDFDRIDEITYWSKQFESKYGCTDCGKDILEAYEQSGEVSPMILRRYGITEGNRQTMTLGMFMSQLVSPEKFSLNLMLKESHSPEGELLSEYARKEFDGEAHQGETPLWAADQMVAYAKKAVEAIDRVDGVTTDREEFSRLKNDMYCYEAMALFYSEKVKAAISVLKYGYTKEIVDLEVAIPSLEKSVVHFRTLTELTKDSYRYANSMQTAQRRIPMGGNEGKNKTWEELLPFYENELTNFKKNVELLKSMGGVQPLSNVNVLDPVEVDMGGKYHGKYELKAGQRPFVESEYVIEGVAPELSQLLGVKYSFEELDDNDTEVIFTNKKPVKMVIGFFQSDKTEFLSPPTLEFDASANFYGQADIKILNALRISGLPPLNVHTYTFEPGSHSLLFDNDVFLVLGFISADDTIQPRDAGFTVSGKATGLDWLFH
ncbi:MAG: hypothetical protein RIA69_17955 [Cyclobacteriaceae bacterium]